MTFVEQIAEEIDAFELHMHIDCRVDPMMAAKIASLQRLKAIDEVQVPEEPEFIGDCRHYGTKSNWIAYIDTLRDLLKKESARADYNGEQWAASAEAILVVNKRAEAAEAKLAAIKEQTK